MLLPIMHLKITPSYLGQEPPVPQHTETRPIVPAHGNGTAASTDSPRANAPGTVFYTHEPVCASKQPSREVLLLSLL